jgi:hypothetical protein
LEKELGIEVQSGDLQSLLEGLGLEELLLPLLRLLQLLEQIHELESVSSL